MAIVQKYFFKIDKGKWATWRNNQYEDTVDGTNPAPLRGYETVALSP